MNTSLQPSGLDVNQSPHAQNRFWRSCTGATGSAGHGHVTKQTGGGEAFTCEIVFYFFSAQGHSKGQIKVDVRARDTCIFFLFV